MFVESRSNLRISWNFPSPVLGGSLMMLMTMNELRFNDDDDDAIK